MAKKKKTGKKHSVFGRIMLVFVIIIGLLLLAVIGFAGVLTVTEYKPEDSEDVEIALAGEEPKQTFSGESFTVLTGNVGYCALGRDSDFFMDGGSSTRPKSEETVNENLTGIIRRLQDIDADFVFLQEVDYNSKRSWKYNEKDSFISSMNADSAFALNYSCVYVPYPIPDTLGPVHSGILTLSNFKMSSAKRYALPCPFSWPMSAANLKRGLLVTRVPIEGSGRELVLVNLHLEAYDDGEGKIAQTSQLMTFLETEYGKGNYVVAGGDFNQLFPDADSVYPITHPELWQPGYLESDTLGAGWQYCYDTAVPSCRLLNQPYNPEDTENTQYYIIDGFIVSPNLTVDSVETLDEGFVYSDHNPVLLRLTMN